jgi:enolase
MEIKNIIARQIIDSRGNPTVEADVWLKNGVFGRAAVPSGASTGSHEAVELRDNGPSYRGQSVTKATENIHNAIKPALVGMNAAEQALIDQKMKQLDGTSNKANLGANAILAVSLACAHAAAKSQNLLLYAHVNNLAGNPAKSLPMPMMNILNGGKHANGSADFQEFMIVPIGAATFKQAVQMGSEIFHSLKNQLTSHGFSTAVGDEGGFTLPISKQNSEALDAVSKACTSAGYQPGKDIVFAMDIAASEFFENGQYLLHAENRRLTEQEMITYIQELAQQYPIASIEDPLAEDAWSSWTSLTDAIANVQVVGDDLLVTNPERIKRAIDTSAANAVLIKPNQIGTLTETLEAIKMAQTAGWRTIISHRSGETEDTTIAHIATGTGAGQIKTGSMSRGERTAKYNELLRIEEIDPSLHLNHPF